MSQWLPGSVNAKRYLRRIGKRSLATEKYMRVKGAGQMGTGAKASRRCTKCVRGLHELVVSLGAVVEGVWSF